MSNIKCEPFRKRLLYPKFGLAKVLGESLSIKRKEK